VKSTEQDTINTLPVPILPRTCSNHQ